MDGWDQTLKKNLMMMGGERRMNKTPFPIRSHSIIKKKKCSIKKQTKNIRKKKERHQNTVREFNISHPPHWRGPLLMHQHEHLLSLGGGMEQKKFLQLRCACFT